jgi:hypothetical protein
MVADPCRPGILGFLFWQQMARTLLLVGQHSKEGSNMASRLTFWGGNLFLVMVMGCAGSADDVCTLAAQHLEQCMGTTLPLPDTCDATKATRVLQANCAALVAEGTRSTSSFSDLWDWLFGDGDDEGGNDGWGWGLDDGDDPEPEEPQSGKCWCDSQCAMVGDCCSYCPGGHYPNPISDYGYRCATAQGICKLDIPQALGTVCECPDGRKGSTAR